MTYNEHKKEADSLEYEMGILCDTVHIVKYNEFEIIKPDGKYYFPQSEKLREGLEKVILFPSAKLNSGIPNGSVFVYDDSTIYNPAILGPDIGCGITAFIVGEIEYNKNNIQDIMQVVNEMNIDIGQGNHFLDFTGGHPTKENIANTKMIYLHSDFNPENKIPEDLKTAIEMIKIAKDKRIEFLDELVARLGIVGYFYRNWTHNSVAKENGKLVYRKGAINLAETEYIGILAIGPVKGLYLYVGVFPNYQHSMQHGSGKKASKAPMLKHLPKLKYENVIAYYDLHRNSDIIEDNQLEAYNSSDAFIKHYALEQDMIGFCLPEVVIETKF